MAILSKEKIYPVLGIKISPYNKAQFYDIIQQRFEDSNPVTPPLFVVTVNPEIVVQSIMDPEFRKILAASSINTADGVGISWAIQRLYNQKVERITGSDSFLDICRLCATHNESVFLYGAMPDVASNTVQYLRKHIPELSIQDFYSPSRPLIPFEELPFDTQYYLKRASVIFVALGAPNQEKWIYNNLDKLPKCKLIIGIGGSFDFVSGHVRRAPSWVCKIGMEWVYRLARQPARWRRMLRLPVFALNVMLLKISEKENQNWQAGQQPGLHETA